MNIVLDSLPVVMMTVEHSPSETDHIKNDMDVRPFRIL